MFSTVTAATSRRDAVDAAGRFARPGGGPVESQLARLAAAVGPLRRVLAAIAARLLDSRAYERLCYARLGDYARERAGVSARQLQDLARVHRALAALPCLEAALNANALPWSKVRLVARVAQAENEQEWIARAHGLSVRGLAAAVRKASPDSSSGSEEKAPLRHVGLRCSPEVLEKWHRARELAERMAGQRLRDAEVLEWVAAEVFAAVGFAAGAPEVAGRGRVRASREIDEANRGLRVVAQALPPEIAALGEGLDGADAFELDRRLRAALRLEQRLEATIAPLLRVVAATDHEWTREFRTLDAFARESLGMAPSKARALRRLDRAGEVCPELGAAFRSGRVSWLKAHCLLPLLLLDLPGEWRPRWVAWAERVTLRRLERDVARALLLRAGHHEAWHRCKFHPERAQDPIPESERRMCAHEVDVEATQRLSWRAEPEVAQVFVGAREAVRRRLMDSSGRWITDGVVFDAMLDVAIATWEARDPAARRPDPVIERDGYQCAVPGCTSRRELHDHHIVFRSAGGSDDESNRVTLCAFHHHRCVHAGRMRVTGRAPERLWFELGWRRGRPALARYRSGDLQA